MLQLNRFMTRQNIIEDNELNDAEINSVFSQLRPEIGAGEGAKYLEEDADKIIGKVRRRQLSLGQMSFAGEQKEDARDGIDFNGTMEPFERIANGIERLIDVLVPKTSELVGTEYIAEKLGVSKQWVGEMAANGMIPKNCIAPKISGGRIWKFHRDRIDAWLNEKR